MYRSTGDTADIRTSRVALPGSTDFAPRVRELRSNRRLTVSGKASETAVIHTQLEPIMAAAGTMDVTITFTGLFLFVPDGTTSLYVMLPATSGGMRHVACLSDGEKECDVEYKDGGDLSFAGLSGATGFNRPPDSAFDLYRITKKRMPRNQLEKTPKDVFLRLKLPLASIPLEAGKTAEWEVPGISPNPLLSHRVIWTRSGVPRAKLTMERRKFGSVTVAQSFDFYPQGDKLTLHFDHVPPDEGCPFKGFSAAHFAHYFHVYDPRESPKIPKLAQDPDELCPRESKPLDRFDQRDRRAASTFTCMTAQVPAG